MNFKPFKESGRENQIVDTTWLSRSVLGMLTVKVRYVQISYLVHSKKEKNELVISGTPKAKNTTKSGE